METGITWEESGHAVLGSVILRKGEAEANIQLVWNYKKADFGQLKKILDEIRGQKC